MSAWLFSTFKPTPRLLSLVSQVLPSRQGYLGALAEGDNSCSAQTVVTSPAANNPGTLVAHCSSIKICPLWSSATSSRTALLLGGQAKLHEYAINGKAAHFTVDADQIDARHELVAHDLLHLPTAKTVIFGMIEPLFPALTVRRLLATCNDPVDVFGQWGEIYVQHNGALSTAENRHVATCKERGMTDCGVARPAPQYSLSPPTNRRWARTPVQTDSAGAMTVSPPFSCSRNSPLSNGPHPRHGVLDMVFEVPVRAFGEFVCEACAPDKINSQLVAEYKWIADFAAQVWAYQCHIEAGKKVVGGGCQPGGTAAQV